MRVIAILVDTYTRYQRYYIDPIAEQLKARGFGVIVVSGREMKPDVRSNQPTYNEANRIYSVAKGYDVAGYVLLTGCIGHNLGRAELDRFVREFTCRPTVSLGVSVPSASSVCSGSRIGMHQLMDHLTKDGTRRQFVFIRGFENDHDSLEREGVFRAVLVERGIPINEDLILTGNYIAVDAYNELDAILPSYPGIDAVVAANDEMASAAVRVLRKHNYQIPSDVVVTGFDNSEIAKYTSPPLTSVLQPISEQVDATVESLISLILNSSQAQSVRPAQYFFGRLKIRESSMESTFLNTSTTLAFHGSPNDAWRQFMLDFIRDHATVDKYSDCGYESQLYKIHDQLKNRNDGVNQLSEILELDVESTQQDLGWWREFENILSTFVVQVSRASIFSSYVTPLLELQMQLRRFTSTLENNIKFDIEHGALLQARLQAMLAKCHSMDSVRHVLDAYFFRYNVSRAFLVLYNSRGGAVDCLAHVAYTYQASQLLNQRLEDSNFNRFESKDILPKAWQDELVEGTLVLNPLYVDDVHLGYLLVDPLGVTTLNYEYFSYALSNTLNRCSGARKISRSTDS